MAFPGVMYRCESWTKGWASKNRCFQTVVLEKTLEGALDCKQIKPVNPKGNQPWPFIKGLILKLKLQNFDHLMQRTDPDAGKDWGLAEKGTTEEEIVGWHHRLNEHEFEWAPGFTGGWGRMARPGMLQCMVLQRVRQDWVTEQEGVMTLTH